MTSSSELNGGAARASRAGAWRWPLLVLAALGAPLLLATAAGAADPPSAKLVVSYVEAPVAGAAGLERSLETYAQRMRRDPASPKVEVLQEVGRNNRMVVVEQWPLDAASPDPGDDAMQKAVDGKLQAPIDRRGFRPLVALLEEGSGPAFHVVMHVDVVPEGAALAARLLMAQRAAVMAAPGALGYEAATQANRTNHFAVHETWASRAAYEAYTAGQSAQELRRRLTPVKGAPYDERFYVSAPSRRARPAAR